MIVTIEKRATTSTKAEFARSIREIDHMLMHVKRTKPGSTWGCNGIDYSVQLVKGHAFRHKSGVGPRNYKRALEEMAQCGCYNDSAYDYRLEGSN